MSPLIPIAIVLGLIIFMVILWAVWQLVKCVIVLVVIVAIIIGLWYFGALDGLWEQLPFAVHGLPL